MKKGKTTRPHAADEKGIRYQPRFAVAIECRNERDQRRLYNRLRKSGLEPKVLVL
ncbi:MAG: hypothetical protein KF841_14355 [Phycisphaerae bacterium]|nr:hypothetical protein [Phycisphaerae bacterium]